MAPRWQRAGYRLPRPVWGWVKKQWQARRLPSARGPCDVINLVRISAHKMLGSDLPEREAEQTQRVSRLDSQADG